MVGKFAGRRIARHDVRQVFGLMRSSFMRKTTRPDSLAGLIARSRAMGSALLYMLFAASLLEALVLKIVRAVRETDRAVFSAEDAVLTAWQRPMRRGMMPCPVRVDAPPLRKRMT